jgi:hypothetical protein
LIFAASALWLAVTQISPICYRACSWVPLSSISPSSKSVAGVTIASALIVIQRKVGWLPDGGWHHEDNDHVVVARWRALHYEWPAYLDYQRRPDL